MSIKIHNAIEFATICHDGQKRKGTETPYIVHPMEVMQILTANGCTEDEIIAGILHDTIEDTDATIEEIRELFGDNVARIVAFESENKALSWHERKSITIERLKQCDTAEAIVCLGDKLSNMRSIAVDYEKIGDLLWDRFKAGQQQVAWYYKSIEASLERLENTSMYKEFIELVHKVFD